LKVIKRKRTQLKFSKNPYFNPKQHRFTKKEKKKGTDDASAGPTILGRYWPISSEAKLGPADWADLAHMFK
jgi:hypothetical protein